MGCVSFVHGRHPIEYAACDHKFWWFFQLLWNHHCCREPSIPVFDKNLFESVSEELPPFFNLHRAKGEPVPWFDVSKSPLVGPFDSLSWKRHIDYGVSYSETKENPCPIKHKTKGNAFHICVIHLRIHKVKPFFIFQFMQLSRAAYLFRINLFEISIIAYCRHCVFPHWISGGAENHYRN